MSNRCINIANDLWYNVISFLFTYESGKKTITHVNKLTTNSKMQMPILLEIKHIFNGDKELQPLRKTSVISSGLVSHCESIIAKRLSYLTHNNNLRIENSDLEVSIKSILKFITFYLKELNNKNLLYHQILQYYKNKDKDNIKKQIRTKIKIVDLLFVYKVLPQSEIRKGLSISIDNRSNFYKTHILPLIHANIIKRVVLTNKARPYYELSSLFVDELNNNELISTTQILHDLVNFSGKEIIKENNPISRHNSDLINF